MSRENYGMMNQEIQDDEVTIDLMELFSALWAKKTIIILSAVFMALVEMDVSLEYWHNLIEVTIGVRYY